MRNLNAVCLDFIEDTVRFVATDGMRLTYYDVQTENFEQQMPDNLEQILLPLSAVQFIKKHFKSSKTKTIAIKIGSSDISIENEYVLYSARLIQQTYPDYKRLINGLNEEVCIVNGNKDEFIKRLKLIEVLSEKGYTAVDLDINGEKLLISIRNNNVGTGEFEIPCEIEGNVKLFLNPKMLAQALQVMESEEVVLKFFGSDKPIVLLQKENDNYLHLLMPMRG